MIKNPAFWLIPVVIIFYLLSVGKPLLIPLVLAVFIWYLIHTLTGFFTKIPLGGRIRMPKPLAFCVSLVAIAASIYFASRVITTNIVEVAAAAPAYQYNLELMSRQLFAVIPWYEPLSISKLIADIDFGATARFAAREMTSIFGQGTFVLLYLLFIFLEQRSFGRKLIELIPNTGRQNKVNEIIRRIDLDVRTYLGIKTVASVFTALLSYLIFLSIGLDFAGFWAFLIFLFNYIPTIGSIVATVLPSLMALVQYEGFGPFFIILIGVSIVQLIISSVLEPRFMGDRLNVSPLVIVISLALWNKIWGIPGMILCIPITSIGMIIFSHFPQTRMLAVALSRNGKLSESAFESAPPPEEFASACDVEDEITEKPDARD
ncbi:MAG: AI-2E family transporter [Chitinispirillales bacterium]|jgi:predicted PurR-regulated permease PerM|nr:AI-2E family transporter [Chitinispirillales bacterium]